MKKYAQIVNGKLIQIFEFPHEMSFQNDMHVVEITDMVPPPREGWDWNGETFLPPPEPSTELVLQSARSVIGRQVSDLIQQRRAMIAGTSDAIEVAAWTNKHRIALDIKSGVASDVDVASFEAEIALRSVEGETIQSFTDKVLANAARYSMVVATLDGIKRNALNMINQAGATSDLDGVLKLVQTELDEKFKSS